MTQLTWETPSEYSHEFGISHGVLNLDGTIIPWSGLTSVSEDHEEFNWNRPTHDGVVYANVQAGGILDLSVSSLAFPDEALSILGMGKAAEGIFVAGQSHQQFDFAYRSKIDESNYRLHLIWNATMTRPDVEHTTLGKSDEVDGQKYNITITPLTPPFPNTSPIARLILSTVEVSLEDISTIEDQLYGTEISDPVFPSMLDIIMTLLL